MNRFLDSFLNFNANDLLKHIKIRKWNNSAGGNRCIFMQKKQFPCNTSKSSNNSH